MIPIGRVWDICGVDITEMRDGGCNSGVHQMWRLVENRQESANDESYELDQGSFNSEDACTWKTSGRILFRTSCRVIGAPMVCKVKSSKRWTAARFSRRTRQEETLELGEEEPVKVSMLSAADANAIEKAS